GNDADRARGAGLQPEGDPAVREARLRARGREAPGASSRRRLGRQRADGPPGLVASRNMYLLLKLLHVLAAFGLVTGLVGRAVTFRGAARAGTIDPAAALLGASHWFDARLVIPSFFGVAVTGPIAALAGHISWTVGGRPSWTLAAALLLLLPTPLIPTVLVPRRRRRETALHDAV